MVLPIFLSALLNDVIAYLEGWSIEATKLFMEESFRVDKILFSVDGDKQNDIFGVVSNII